VRDNETHLRNTARRYIVRTLDAPAWPTEAIEPWARRVTVQVVEVASLLSPSLCLLNCAQPLLTSLFASGGAGPGGGPDRGPVLDSAGPITVDARAGQTRNSQPDRPTTSGLWLLPTLPLMPLTGDRMKCNRLVRDQRGQLPHRISRHSSLAAPVRAAVGPCEGLAALPGRYDTVVS
jgi:hypothetical protein